MKTTNALPHLYLIATLATPMGIPVLASAEVLKLVIVTAKKRKQSIQDVGISTTAKSGKELRTLNMTSTISCQWN